jgi:hypothetical protein
MVNRGLLCGAALNVCFFALLTILYFDYLEWV